MTIIRREYFPVRKQVKPTEQLIINGTALPYAYSFDGAADITVRAKSEKRGYSHGSTISGDGFIDGKKITLGFVIEGSTPAEHDAKLNDLYQLMYQRDYQLQSGSGRGYYNIACMASTKEKWVDSFKGTKGEVDITLLLSDPFRYDSAESEKVTEFTAAAKDAQIVISNGGSVETPLTIELIPLTTMNDVTITHVESGYSMRVADTLLTKPATLIVDTKAGTVRRGTYNAINAFSGQFLTARPGENTYLFNGAAGTVKISWRNRWLA